MSNPKQLSERNAEIVAKFWANQLRRATPPQVDNGEIDDEEFSNLAALMGMTRSPSNEGISEEQVTVFERHLIQVILREDPFVISVDYEPDGWLIEAGNVAGINIGYRLPIKTVTYVSSLQVRKGYSASLENLS